MTVCLLSGRRECNCVSKNVYNKVSTEFRSWLCRVDFPVTFDETYVLCADLNKKKYIKYKNSA